MESKTSLAFLALLLILILPGAPFADGNGSCVQSCSDAFNSCNTLCGQDYGPNSANRGTYISGPIEEKCSGSHEAAYEIAGGCYQQSADQLSSCLNSCGENSACGTSCVAAYDSRNINTCGSQYLDYCHEKCSGACTQSHSACRSVCTPETQGNGTGSLTIPGQNGTAGNPAIPSQNGTAGNLTIPPPNETAIPPSCISNCTPDQENNTGGFTIPDQNITWNASLARVLCAVLIEQDFDGVSADGVSSIKFTLTLLGEYSSFKFDLVPPAGEPLRGKITRPNPTTIIFTPDTADANKDYLVPQTVAVVAECVPAEGEFEDIVARQTTFTIEQPPLFFVHGYDSSAAEAWPNFERRAIAQGWQHSDITYPNKQDIALSSAQLAGELRSFIRKIHNGEFYGKKKISATKVDIISHSMGGLVTRYYIGNAYQGDIRKFIMIGTPNAGSAFARLGPGMASTQMIPNSQFLQTLNSQANNPDIDYHAIAGTGWHTPGPWSYDGDGVVLVSSVRLQGVPLYCTWDAHGASAYWSTTNTKANRNGGGYTTAEGGTLTTSDAAWGITSSAILTGTAASAAPCPAAPASGAGTGTSGTSTGTGASGTAGAGATGATGGASTGASGAAGEGAGEAGAGTGSAGATGSGSASSSSGKQGVSGTVRSPVLLHAYDEYGNHIGPTKDGGVENTIGTGAYYSDGSETGGHQKIIVYADRKIRFVIEGQEEGEFGFDFERWNSEGETSASQSFESIKTGPGALHELDSWAEKPALSKKWNPLGAGSGGSIPCPAALVLLGLLMVGAAAGKK